MALHGLVRATMDIDLVLNLKESDFAKAEQGLSEYFDHQRPEKVEGSDSFCCGSQNSSGDPSRALGHEERIKAATRPD